jgi:hypothetical protein
MELAVAVGGTLHGAARIVARTARRNAAALLPVESGLPVAGLDVVAAQAIHYTLRHLDEVIGWPGPGPGSCRAAAAAGGAQPGPPPMRASRVRLGCRVWRRRLASGAPPPAAASAAARKRRTLRLPPPLPAQTLQGEDTADAWLRALQLSQLAFDR